MDRDYYRSLTEAYQSIYEAPGAGIIGGQLLRQGGKVGGSMALQSQTGWPEYTRFRDEGHSHEDAVKKVAETLGLNVAGSVIGSGVGSLVGPKGTIAGGVVGGPAMVAAMNSYDKQYTQKQNQYRAGVVWDDKTGKYVHKPENLTQGRREPDEDFAARQKAGKEMAKQLNSAEGGAKAPEWLEWERENAEPRREAEAQQQLKQDRLGKHQQDAINSGGSVGKSKDAAKVDNYTVGGIEYDGKTGRPVTPPPQFVPGQSRTPPAAETETETETQTTTPQGTETTRTLDDIINEPYTADQNIPANKPGDVIKPETGGTSSATPSGGNVSSDNKPQETGGTKLTPMQQWAKNFPKLAAKVKQGQAGYDEIQAMNKATPALTQDAAKAGQTGGGVVDGARRAASKVKDAAQKAGNSSVGQRVTQATDNAIKATRNAARKAAGSSAVRTVKDQAGKGLNRLNNAVRNRTGNNNNE